MPNRIKCDTIEHRKGYIEVTPGIHDQCINLETWSVRPDIDLSEVDIRDFKFPDDGITGNTEIELNLDQARSLIQTLQRAITKV